MILICMFTFSAAIKWLRTGSMVQHWRQYRYPMWFMSVIASLELAGAAAIVASWLIPQLAFYAALLLAALMLGALHAHLVRAKHRPVMVINALFMLALSVTLMVIK
ncbi:DoxX family protein [Paenibacillus sp. H1-7]|nr:DoxX family protein [Paenibacillus sp. H1-7]